MPIYGEQGNKNMKLTRYVELDAFEIIDHFAHNLVNQIDHLSFWAKQSTVGIRAVHGLDPVGFTWHRTMSIDRPENPTQL